MEWYQHKELKSRITFNVIRINNTNIFITKNPLDGWPEDEAKKIDAWVNVSDVPCNSLSYIPWKCERFWFPIAEVHNWTYNHAYWIKKVLDTLVFNRDDIHNIVVHCEAGAKRSPMSVFMWLISLYGKKTAAKILWFGKDEIQESKIKNLENGGLYGEMCYELETFYKVYKMFPNHSLESLFLKFGQVASHPLPVPQQIAYLHKKRSVNRSTIIKDLKTWYSPFITVSEKLDINLHEHDLFAYSHLMPAEDFFKSNQCQFSKNELYNWYLNQLMAKPSWKTPIIINRSEAIECKLESLSVLNLKDAVKLIRFQQVNVDKDDDSLVSVS